MSCFYFPIASAFICLLTNILFFGKKHQKNFETKTFAYMLIFNLLETFIAIIIISLSKSFGTIPILYFINRIDFILLSVWCSLLCIYIHYISNPNGKYNFLYLICILDFFVIISLLTTEFSIINIGEIINTSGTAPNLTAIYCAFFALIMLIDLIIKIIKKKQNLKLNKYYPLFMFIILIILSVVLRNIWPTIVLEPFMISFINLIMYFTIENPDLKMIEELNIARDQAEKANNAKSEFLSNMSHEIRTPLNAIVGFSQALLEEEIPDSAKEEVEDIISASQSLLEIVNGILDISKIEANKLEIVNTEYSFKKIFNELINLTKARMGDKALDFRYTYDETIPDVLYGDHVRIKQIILNLLTNAVKYTKEGYIDFKISSVVKNDICRLIVSVEDSGIGIKNENIDKLFSKFERFDLEQNITIEGTGLGLAITKKLIDLMNGKIVVQSVYGKGSRFTVAIDQRIINKNLEDIEQPKQNIEFNNFDYSTKKILIVDDNKINIKVAERLLKDYKVQVESVLSGFECLDKINNGNIYDLILLDDMMPKMSGVETLKELKKIDGFNIPTVALTANAISGMREKYLNEGFDDYLSKPIDKNELSNILNKYLNN